MPGIAAVAPMALPHTPSTTSPAWPPPRGCAVVLHGEKLMLGDDFLEEHPGGSDIIWSLEGRDCTKEFEEIGHSTSARLLARRFAVSTSTADGERDVIRAERRVKTGRGEQQPFAASTSSSSWAARFVGARLSWAPPMAGDQGQSLTWLEDSLPLTLGLISVASAIAAWRLRGAAWQ
mmetsp:Transcript_110775/g.277322  ORF Transcript_110775/g.277322 Transcript_110775/m.277322 type:complete len:177 (+) Transcript_110775:92-622(+)